MRYFPVLVASIAVSAFWVADAEPVRYGTSELSGGPVYQAQPDPADRIIDVQRQQMIAEGRVPYGPNGPAVTTTRSASSTYVEEYQRSQIQNTPRRHPGAESHYNSGYSTGSHPHTGYTAHQDGRNDAATSYGFEWWASDPYYGQTRPSAHYSYHDQAPSSREVTIYRGSTTTPAPVVSHGGATRPCSYYSAPATHTPCPYAGQYSSNTVTTYVSPAPTYVAPAPTYSPPVYVDPAPEYDYAYDYAPVQARHRGFCKREITRIGKDRKGRQQYEVCYADLRPVEGPAVEELYDRIERAADRACRDNSGYAMFSRRNDCEDQAVDRAVYDTGIASLQRYHNIRTGRGRPRVTVGPLRRY
ncbi:hypothetical protein [Henriciella litoralis]|uniref:hypothetical protein n=1 Tax=Henriciella litoralis TaxID=568102 RepID=UPI0009FD1ECA|nr:hypothetical protein [Henriciella litoralis]